jgi:hypothetical protein
LEASPAFRQELDSVLRSELPSVLHLKRLLVLHSTVLVGMPAGANSAFHQKLNQAQIVNGRLVLHQTARSDWLPGTNPAFRSSFRSSSYSELHLGLHLKLRPDL